MRLMSAGSISQDSTFNDNKYLLTILPVVYVTARKENHIKESVHIRGEPTEHE